MAALWLSGGCVKSICKVLGGSLKGVWRVSMGCSNGNLVGRTGDVRIGQVKLGQVIKV